MERGRPWAACCTVPSGPLRGAARLPHPGCPGPADHMAVKSGFRCKWAECGNESRRLSDGLGTRPRVLHSPHALPSVSQDDEKSFRRAPSWRKKFRPKDVRGLAAGSAETLPANFRVTSSLSSPSVLPKKMQLDGT